MRLAKGMIAAAVLSTLVLATLSCKKPKNTNTGNLNQPPPPSTHRWALQWRSPRTVGLSGTNLGGVYWYNGISVVSPEVVFVAGEMPNPKDNSKLIGVVVRTTNGGQSWTETTMDMLASRNTTMNSIHFVNPNVGWIVGATSSGQDEKAEGFLLKTVDGGANWEVSKVPSKQIPTTVFFTDEKTGWMGGATPSADGEDSEGGPSDILATTDGGRTWRSQVHLSTSINDVFFLADGSGWAGGFKGAIYNTTDGGRVWSQQRSELEFDEHFKDPKDDNAKDFAIAGIHFIDSRNGLAAAGVPDVDEGRILGTTNGGTTWARKLIAQGEEIRNVVMVSPTEGYAVSRVTTYIYHSNDGGRFWQAENVLFEQAIPLKLAAADSTHVWAVGAGAIFFREPQ